MPHVTLKHLAQELNLSVASVCRALQGSKDISARNIERVRALAAARHYRPNAYARSLRSKKSKTIGVVIPKVSNHFFALAINGIEQAARQQDYHVLICLTHDDYAREVTIMQHLRAGRVDGLLMSVASSSEHFGHILDLQAQHLPIVFFDRVCAEVATASVTTNDYAISFQATEHLLAAGCRRIAHLSSAGNLSISQLRLQGYRDALSQHGLPAEEELMLYGALNDRQNVQLMRDLLRHRPDVDGVFAAAERLAISTYHACHELNCRIPEHLKVISFSNFEAAALLNPPLSTINQPAYEIGYEAATLLIEAIEHQQPLSVGQSKLLEATLLPRQSTAALAAS